MKVNNPIVTHETVIDYIKSNKIWGVKHELYFDLLYKLGLAEFGMDTYKFIRTFDQITLNKFFHELKQL